MPNRNMDGWEIVDHQGQQAPINAQPQERMEDQFLKQEINVRREQQERDRIDTLNKSKTNAYRLDRLLEKTTGKANMTEEETAEKEKLSVIRDRQLSNVLLNEERRKNESKDMLKFKDALWAVETLIGNKHMKDTEGRFSPVTGAELVSIEEAYSTAIKAAMDYVKERKKKANSPKVVNVNAAMKRLMKEQAMFTQLRMRINAGALTGDLLRAEKPYELLFMARLYEKTVNHAARSAEEKAAAQKPNQALRRSETVKGDVKNLDKSVKPLFSFLTAQKDFANAYKGVKWDKTEDRLFINRMLAFVSRIKPNAFYSGNVAFGDEIVQVNQDEENHLSFVVKGQCFSLQGTTSELVTKLSHTMIDNVRTLGTEGLSYALQATDISDERVARVEDVRSVHDLSVSALEKLGGLEKPLFNNLPTTTIRTLAVHLMKGEMTKEEVREFVRNEEEKAKSKGLAREHNTAMVFFLMKSEEEQNEILKYFSEKRRGENGQILDSWKEVAFNALAEENKEINNQSLFAEIMERVGYLDTETMFLLSSEEDQNSVLNGFKGARDGNAGTLDAARAAVQNRGEVPTNLAVYKEINRMLERNASSRWELDLQKRLQRMHFEHMQSTFKNVPDQMLDVFLKIDREGPITQEEVDHLNNICKAGNFQEQMQTNMHDLEINLLIKRDEMAKKLRVKGIKSVEKKQQMEELKPVLEEKHNEMKEAKSSYAAFGKLMEIKAKTNAVEEQNREDKQDLVQKMVADLVFSRDTGIEAEGENAPGERMKRVLLASVPAIAHLLIDYAHELNRRKEKNVDLDKPMTIPLLKDTLDRIPLGGKGEEGEEGAEEGFAQEVKDKMSEQITGIISAFAKQKIDFDGREMELAEFLTSIKLPIVGTVIDIPQASVAFELEKAIKAQFEENGPAMSLQFAEAEASINESINQATEMIQDLFNEQQGIKIDALGNLALTGKEDRENVNRPSNKDAIDREKKSRVDEREIIKQKEGMHAEFMNLCGADNLAGVINLLKNYPLMEKYLLPIDETKPVEECRRLENDYQNISNFLAFGGDYVAKREEEFEMDSLSAEFYRKIIDESKQLTKGQIMQGLSGTSTDDRERLLDSVPMKASYSACRIIDATKKLKNAKPEDLNMLRRQLSSAWEESYPLLGGYKNDYLCRATSSIVKNILKNAFTWNEDETVATGIANPAMIDKAIQETEDYLNELTGLYRDYEICQQAKNGNAQEKKNAAYAEERFLKTFEQMDKQNFVAKYNQNIFTYFETPNPLIGKKFLEPYFADKNNYGTELKTAYDEVMKYRADYDEANHYLFQKYPEGKRKSILEAPAKIKKVNEELKKEKDKKKRAELEKDIMKLEELVVQRKDMDKWLAKLRTLEPLMMKAKTEFAYNYHRVMENRLRIREWLVDGGDSAGDMSVIPETDEKGRKILERMVSEVAAGTEGTGKFVKLVMGQYFKKMSIQDKRAMISSALREKRKTVMLGGKKIFDPEQDMNAAFISGYLKGAGPLFQKMLQGLPDSALPKEFRQALSDMKSNLAHIPDEVVQARLSALAAESEEISHIDVVRSLGAASVGETFLCKIYGPNMKEGREAVVKILRPDVKNRMDREKAFMLDCAKRTDKGMELTYLGKLKNITEELDFTLEAKNIQLGSVYNKAFDKKKKTDDVEAMKLSNLVKPSSNVMLLEKAEGQTLNKYMDDTYMLHNKVLENNLKRDVFGRLAYRVDPLTNKAKKLGGDDIMAAEKERMALVDRVAALKKRKAHLITLSRKWTYEGIFGEGFYHADLHSGNIQVSDEKAVVLDFGNCTKLSESQQTSIIRMMVSVVAGYPETFRDEFLKLLTETPKDVIEKNRQKFTNAIKYIFKCGNSDDAALRIAAIVSYASKLGFEIPRAVNDFADGALRLQNSIDSIDDAIDMLKEDIKTMTETFINENEGENRLDMVSWYGSVAAGARLDYRNSMILEKATLAGLDLDTVKEQADLLTEKKISLSDFEACFNPSPIDNDGKEENPVLKQDLKQLIDAFAAVVQKETSSPEEKAAARDTFAQRYLARLQQEHAQTEAANTFRSDQMATLDDIFVLDEGKLQRYREEKDNYGNDRMAERFQKAEKNLSQCFKDEKYGADLRASYDQLKALHKAALDNHPDANAFAAEKERFLGLMNKINVRNMMKLLHTRSPKQNGWADASEGSFQQAMGQTIHDKMWTVGWQMGIIKGTGLALDMGWSKIKELFGSEG